MLNFEQRLLLVFRNKILKLIDTQDKNEDIRCSSITQAKDLYHACRFFLNYQRCPLTYLGHRRERATKEEKCGCC